MKICFGSILLNESQYLESSLRQHLSYCDRWVLVEGADRLYPKERVSGAGLSTDNSDMIIRGFMRDHDPHKKLCWIQHGWAENKQELRNRYAEVADNYDALVVIDIDEFLSNESMRLLIRMLERMKGPGTVRLPHVHLWKDHDHIITGGYWDVPHDRAYRWEKGYRYTENHNHPQMGQMLLRNHDIRDVPRRIRPDKCDYTHPEPFWLHFGNCKPAEMVEDKNRYYINRGESTTRPQTTASRAAWFGDLPHYCRILPWNGPMPEVFR